MTTDISIAPVLEQYPPLGPIRRTVFLANAGGFTGSMLWRLERETGDLCLRRWPQEYSAERLAFIHGVLKQYGNGGLSCIPVPLASAHGKTLVSLHSHFWELARWMPGQADFHADPNQTRLRHVMQTVARLHAAGQCASAPYVAPSPTLLSRRHQLLQLLSGGIGVLAAAVNRGGPPRLADRGPRLIGHFRRLAAAVLEKLEAATPLLIPLFPVIRDLWHDHVLFTGDEVTGIVDFGALRVDSVACDLSRLLGSLVGNDRESWEIARQAYNSIRPLSADEWKLTQALDAANVILAGLNWLDWICVQGRTFEDNEAVYTRLDEILSRLESDQPFSPA